jgi:hypothetical protein
LPVVAAASSNNFFEEFGNALDKNQTEKYSVFNKGSEGPSSARATISNGPTPQKQLAGALSKPKSRRAVLQDQAPGSDSVLNRQDNRRSAYRKPHNATSLIATGAEQEHHKDSSTTSQGADSSPVRAKGKKHHRQARK